MPESYVLKVRGGASTYVKRDGTTGTAGKGALTDKELAFTVAATQDQTLIQAMPMKNDTTPKCGNPDDPAFTLRVGGEGGVNDLVAYKHDGYIVRRLTPKECERLQGFPDDWTKVPYDKVMTINAKPDDKGAFILYYDEDTGESVWKKHKKIHVPIEKCPDAPRYKALGNSMAVPVMRWLGERIAMVDALISN